MCDFIAWLIYSQIIGKSILISMMVMKLQPIIVISNILNICLTILFFCLILQYSAYSVILPLIIFQYYIPTLYYVWVHFNWDHLLWKHCRFPSKKAKLRKTCSLYWGPFFHFLMIYLQNYVHTLTHLVSVFGHTVTHLWFLSSQWELCF